MLLVLKTFLEIVNTNCGKLLLEEQPRWLGSGKVLISDCLVIEEPRLLCLFTENSGISPAARRCACRHKKEAAGGAHYRLSRGGCKGKRGDGGPVSAGAGGGGECVWNRVVLLPSCWPRGS